METIVVGASQTDTAALAIERAAELAASLSARLVVVTAYNSDDAEMVGVGNDTYVLTPSGSAAAFAQTTADRLSAALGIDTSAEAAQGRPASVLVDAAERHKAGLIVVGNVRMQGPGRVLGSVASHVAHH